MEVEQVHKYNPYGCPCYDVKGDVFKVADVMNTDLVIYHDTRLKQDLSQAYLSTPQPPHNSLILESNKDVTTKADIFQKTLEYDKITCPRCRYICKRAQKLLQNIAAIDTKDLIDICHHCRMKINPLSQRSVSRGSGDPRKESEKFVNNLKLSKTSKHDVKTKTSIQNFTLTDLEDDIDVIKSKLSDTKININRSTVLNSLGDKKHVKPQQKLKNQDLSKNLSSEIVKKKGKSTTKLKIITRNKTDDETVKPKVKSDSQSDMKQFKLLMAELKAERDKQRLQEIKEKKIREALEKKAQQTKSDVDIEKYQKLSKKPPPPSFPVFKTPEELKDYASKINPDMVKHHKYHKIKVPFCELCNDSLLDLEVQSIMCSKTIKPDVDRIIIGENVLTYNLPPLSKEKKESPPSLLVKSPSSTQEKIHTQIKSSSKQQVDEDVHSTNGIVKYSLSDPKFIAKGWTMLPTEKIKRMMYVYRMRPAQSKFDWFKHNKKKKLLNYDTGFRLAEFDENGCGRLYYQNGQLALDYYDAEEANAQKRFIVYSSGEIDERSHTNPVTILAIFDYLGNGIVFDHAGEIRLKYNQTEGVVLDRNIGPISHWKWHSLNEPPELKKVLIDTHLPIKDPRLFKLGDPHDNNVRSDDKDMSKIELQNDFKEKIKKLSQKYTPFQIKIKAMKINKYFSLKVLDQSTIYLIFRDGSAHIKLNLGMVLDHHEIVDTDIVDVGEVSISMDHFPARTESIAAMQRSVANAKRFERARSEHKRKLGQAGRLASADKLVAVRSQRIELPLIK